MRLLLTVSDVAELLSCSPSQVYVLKDDIPYCKIRGMIRFREEDVLQFILENVVQPHERPTRPKQKRLPTLKHLKI